MPAVAKMAGRRREVLTTSDGVSVVSQTTTIFPHASTHSPSGSDPMDVRSLGGMTAADIRAAIASSAKQCASNMPSDVERKTNKGRRNGYCPLDANGKVAVQYLPAFLQGGAYIPFDTVLPGTLPDPGGGLVFDVLRPPISAYLVMAYATVMTAPVDSAISVEIRDDGGTLLTTLAIAKGETSSAVWKVGADVYYFATPAAPLSLKLTAVGSTSPGEYLRVRTVMKAYTQAGD